MALVHFYRPHVLYGRILETNIFINEKPTVVLSNNTYKTEKLSPGQYKFQAKPKPDTFGNYPHVFADAISEISVSLEPGRTYYIAWYPSNTLSKSEYDGYFLVSNVANPDSGMEGFLSDI